VVKVTRDAVVSVSAEGLVGLRLSCDERAAWAGIVPETAAGLLTALSPLGLDYLCGAVRGSGFWTAPPGPTVMSSPVSNREASAVVRTALPTGVALVAQGSIVDIALAEELVANGEADLVEMTGPRSQIRCSPASWWPERPTVFVPVSCATRHVESGTPQPGRFLHR